jgi:histidinol dehydrogenase
MLEVVDGRDHGVAVRIARPRPSVTSVDEAVAQIVERVRLGGDGALMELTQRFDGVRLERSQLRVDEETLSSSLDLVRPELVDALVSLRERLAQTSGQQRPQGWTGRVGGSTVGEVVRPLARVGVHAGGGAAASPAAVLMTAVPAQVAGVRGIAVASSPGPRGEIPAETLAACSLLGVDEVYRVGGPQAIAALAYGTETVRPVDKVVGPGNLYVGAAKRLVSEWVGVDGIAGPAELAIVADGSADADAIAADLVAQAERGPHGTHVLVTWDPGLAASVASALELHVLRHERAEEIENALTEGGVAALVRDRDHALDTVNALAPARLELVFDGASGALDLVHSAGAVFVGPYSPASVGDHVLGTNSVLPSRGRARWASGLSARDFVRTVYVAELERDDLEQLEPHASAIAEAEGLPAHARAVQSRLDRPVGGD